MNDRPKGPEPPSGSFILLTRPSASRPLYSGDVQSSVEVGVRALPGHRLGVRESSRASARRSERMRLRWRRHAVRALQPVRRYRPAARYFSSRLCGRGRRQDAAACLISDRRATPSSTCSPRPEHAESDVRRGDCRRRQTRRRPDCARAESSLAITRSRMGGQSVRCVFGTENGAYR